jgi:hypothetical protein
MQIGHPGQRQMLYLTPMGEALHQQRPPSGLIPAAIGASHKVFRTGMGVRCKVEVGRVEHSGKFIASIATIRDEPCESS